MSDHTPRDEHAFRSHGIAPDDRQASEREHACPLHSPRHPVTTWNLGGYCDEHYRPPAMRGSDVETVRILLPMGG